MEFTASNGVEVQRYALSLQFARDLDEGWLEPWAVVALREYFRAERDEELGRWRWPENPDYVVYARGDGWLVLSERSGNSKHYSHRDHASVGNSELTRAMRAYFEAHPERKPWEDAKPGDIWVLSVEGVESHAVHATAGFLGEVVFKTIAGTNVNMRSSVITDARRIWPESD